MTFRPDHNGECLHCDEWGDAHGPHGECPTDPAQAAENVRANAGRGAWDYLCSDWRRDMITIAKDVTRNCGFTVYDHHHPLCSNFTQAPAHDCWQCRIIASRATDHDHRSDS